MHTQSPMQSHLRAVMLCMRFRLTMMPCLSNIRVYVQRNRSVYYGNWQPPGRDSG